MAGYKLPAYHYETTDWKNKATIHENEKNVEEVLEEDVEVY
jgi:hypothetical protein